ncbi:hypothetical protein ACHAWF_016691 [Thalassiosira exigua]
MTETNISISEFCSSLLIRANSSDDSSSTIQGFDFAKFDRICNVSSPSFHPNLADFEEISKCLFRQGDNWASRDLLKTVVDKIAGLEGWTGIIKHHTLVCNRRGKDTSKRSFKSGALKANCPWKIHFKPLHYISYEPEKRNPGHHGRSKNAYKPNWNLGLEITSVHVAHGGDCSPGRENRIATQQRAGKYVTTIPQHAIYSLCHLLEKTGRLSTSTIQDEMTTVWPQGKVFSKHDSFNIRIRVMRLLPLYRDANGDYDTFKRNVASSEVLGGIDDQPDIDDDEAYELAQQLWLEVESSNMDKEASILSFIEYLDLIKSRATGFVYELATSSNAHTSLNDHSAPATPKKKLLGVLWQTATMRKNFELFGSYLALDMMKKGMSSLLWMYLAVAMYDESKRICIGCEGMLIGEREDMYAFVASFLSKHSPGRPLSSVLIVSGDNFFNEKKIHEFGFVNAHYFTDRWHLFDSGLREMFGQKCYDMLKSHLKAMIYAKTKCAFEDTANAAKEYLLNLNPRNAEHEVALDKFISKKDMYAEYILAEVVGNRGLRGSGMAEQNHSSVLSYLGYDQHSKGTLTAHPNNVIRDLLKRQNRHVKRTNHILFGYSQKLRVIVADLKSDTQVTETVDLLQAASHLGYPEFQRYKANRTRSDERNHKTTDRNEETGQTVTVVSSVENASRVERRFSVDLQERCSCTRRKELQEMCEHEICAYDGFSTTLFEERHFRRDRVTGSLEGWTQDATPDINDVVGYECGLEPIGDVSNGTQSLTQPMPTVTAPPGHLPDRRYFVGPPNTKKIQNILSSVSAGYSQFDNDMKFELADLAMQMQDVVTRSIHKSSKTEIMQNLSVDVPGTEARKKQPRKRLKPTHEKIREKIGKQRSAKLARLGFDQDIQHNDLVVTCNARTQSRRRCTFCLGNHIVTHCDRRETWQIKSTEYTLSGKKTHIEASLRQRLIHAMPITDINLDEYAVLGTITSTMIASNIVVNGAAYPGKGPRMTLDGMYFNVSFLGGDGEVHPDWSSCWITGAVMNQIITHTQKKYKYVYDATVLVPNSTVTLSQDAMNIQGVKM